MVRTRLAAIVAMALAAGSAAADDAPPHVPVNPPGTVFKPDDVLRAIGLGASGQSAQTGADANSAEGLSNLAQSLGGWLKDHPELAKSMAKPMMEMLAKNPDLLKAQPPEGVQKLMEDFAKSDAGKSLAGDPDFLRQFNESGLKEKLESLWPLMKNQMGEEKGAGGEGSGQTGEAGGFDREKLMKFVESLSGAGDRSAQKQDLGDGIAKGNGAGSSGSDKSASQGGDVSKWIDGVRKSFTDDGSKGKGEKGAGGESGSGSGSESVGNLGKGRIGGRSGTGGASGSGSGSGDGIDQSKLAAQTAENARKLSDMFRKAIGDQAHAESIRSALDSIGKSVNSRPPTPTFGERLLPTKQMFGGLGDNIGAAASWASRTGKFVSDTLGKLPRPTLPNAMSAPRFTPPSLAGLGSMFSAPSAETGKSLGVFLAVAAAIALGAWLLWRSPTEAIRAAIVRTFRRPLNLAGLTERERVAKLFEHAAVVEMGESALPRNHRRAARDLAELKSGEAEAAEELAQLYELARYSPPKDEISPNAGATAYGLLYRLNAAPKVVGEPPSVAR